MSGLRESLEAALAKRAAEEQLSLTLNEWEEDDKARSTATVVQAGVTQSVFNFLKANPHISKKAAITALDRKGFNPGSTRSIMSHMVREGMVRSTDGKLLVIADSYTPLKQTKRVVVAPRKEVRIVTKTTQLGLASLKQSESVQTQDAKPVSLLDTLSVRQAYALYVELKTMFGGN